MSIKTVNRLLDVAIIVDRTSAPQTGLEIRENIPITVSDCRQKFFAD